MNKLNIFDKNYEILVNKSKHSFLYINSNNIKDVLNKYNYSIDNINNSFFTSIK